MVTSLPSLLPHARTHGLISIEPLRPPSGQGGEALCTCAPSAAPNRALLQLTSTCSRVLPLSSGTRAHTTTRDARLRLQNTHAATSSEPARLRQGVCAPCVCKHGSCKRGQRNERCLQSDKGILLLLTSTGCIQQAVKQASNQQRTAHLQRRHPAAGVPHPPAVPTAGLPCWRRPARAPSQLVGTSLPAPPTQAGPGTPGVLTSTRQVMQLAIHVRNAKDLAHHPLQTIAKFICIQSNCRRCTW
jgi:hypothetical protein